MLSTSPKPELDAEVGAVGQALRLPGFCKSLDQETATEAPHHVLTCGGGPSAKWKSSRTSALQLPSSPPLPPGMQFSTYSTRSAGHYL
jgi:hypothetical protein